MYKLLAGYSSLKVKGYNLTSDQIGPAYPYQDVISLSRRGLNISSQNVSTTQVPPIDLGPYDSIVRGVIPDLSLGMYVSPYAPFTWPVNPGIGQGLVENVKGLMSRDPDCPLPLGLKTVLQASLRNIKELFRLAGYDISTNISSSSNALVHFISCNKTFLDSLNLGDLRGVSMNGADGRYSICLHPNVDVSGVVGSGLVDPSKLRKAVFVTMHEIMHTYTGHTPGSLGDGGLMGPFLSDSVVNRYILPDLSFRPNKVDLELFSAIVNRHKQGRTYVPLPFSQASQLNNVVEECGPVVSGAQLLKGMYVGTLPMFFSSFMNEFLKVGFPNCNPNGRLFSSLSMLMAMTTLYAAYDVEGYGTPEIMACGFSSMFNLFLGNTKIQAMLREELGDYKAYSAFKFMVESPYFTGLMLGVTTTAKIFMSNNTLLALGHISFTYANMWLGGMAGGFLGRIARLYADYRLPQVADSSSAVGDRHPYFQDNPVIPLETFSDEGSPDVGFGSIAETSFSLPGMVSFDHDSNDTDGYSSVSYDSDSAVNTPSLTGSDSYIVDPNSSDGYSSVAYDSDLLSDYSGSDGVY